MLSLQERDILYWVPQLNDNNRSPDVLMSMLERCSIERIYAIGRHCESALSDIGKRIVDAALFSKRLQEEHRRFEQREACLNAIFIRGIFIQEHLNAVTRDRIALQQQLKIFAVSCQEQERKVNHLQERLEVAAHQLQEVHNNATQLLLQQREGL